MRLTVCTRKGLLVFGQTGQRWSLLQHHFPGEPVTAFLADRDGTFQLAALRLGHFGVKLRASTDGGQSWLEAPGPAYPPKPADAHDANPWALDQVWTLEGLHERAPDRLWAGTIPGGLFRSDDRGRTWHLNAPLWDMPERRRWFGGGYDQPGIHSVAVSADDPDDLVVAASCGGVWGSRDGGRTWTVGTGMVAAYMPPEQRNDPVAQDPHRVVRCRKAPRVLWAQHHCGVWRSVDGGCNWSPVQAARPSGFGFAVAVDPNDPQRAWLVPAASDSQRIPVDASLVVSRTSDGGGSFEIFGEGLPQQHAYHLVYRHGLAVADDAVHLAMGSTTGSLWVSESAGQQWQRLSAELAPIYAVSWN